MPRSKPPTDDSQQVIPADGAASSRKPSVDADAVDLEATPTKRRRSSTTRGTQVLADDTETDDYDEKTSVGVSAEHMSDAPLATATTPRRRGRPPNKAKSQTSSTPSKTPTTTTKSIFATPVKNHAAGISGISGPNTPKRQAADRSARKKSARALIQNVVGDDRDSHDEDQDDDVLVREIYEDSDDGQNIPNHHHHHYHHHDASPPPPLQGGDATATVPEGDGTPSRSGLKRRRGRAKRATSPTPPRHLPPHELYFAHNKPGRPKTSDNTLASLAMLTHDEYFSLLNDHVDRHGQDVEYLEDLHAQSFPQWMFELSQGYSICLYGFGSKRRLLQKLAKHVHASHRADYSQTTRKTIIVNGYTHATTLREILTCVCSAVDPSLKPPASSPAAMLASILAHPSLADLDLALDLALTLTIIINSIDAAPLRKPATQSVLSQLASHPRINLVCSADTPDFPLLWDIGIRSAFNFVFHDCTTFAPFTVELDVIDEVHELLGRKARRVNGREGVAFVLKSLPENAKNLFQLLVGEVLVATEDQGPTHDEEPAGVEYRIVYNKAVEEFICSSEMAFRTLLKEFHDHQMITSRKDALGTELLSVPFQKEELEAILEDLTS